QFYKLVNQLSPKENIIATSDFRSIAKFSSVQHQENKISFINSYNGVHIYKVDNQINYVLKDKKINRSYIDNEGNYWFCSFDEGIFKVVNLK
ncbi:hypothetical protein ABTM39_19700, partial [Acinetobacter baumannii]